MQFTLTAALAVTFCLSSPEGIPFEHALAKKVLNSRHLYTVVALRLPAGSVEHRKVII